MSIFLSLDCLVHSGCLLVTIWQHRAMSGDGYKWSRKMEKSSWMGGLHFEDEYLASRAGWDKGLGDFFPGWSSLSEASWIRRFISCRCSVLMVFLDAISYSTLLSTGTRRKLYEKSIFCWGFEFLIWKECSPSSIVYGRGVDKKRRWNRK